MALKDNDTLWAWGWNKYGQLGDETTDNSETPVQVAGLDHVIKIAAGGYHTVALRQDGTVWDWGYNLYGQLGDGTNDYSAAAVQVANLTSVIDVDAGLNHTVALKEDGTVWAWGYNYNGVLGAGTIDHSGTPLQVAELTNIIMIAAGDNHTLALKEDGTIWAWRYNSYGQLGDGTNDHATTPVRIAGLTNVVDIAAGGNHTLALKEDGTIWAWGHNSYGQLGDGTINNSTIPLQIAVLTNVIEISAGGYHSLALKQDGSFFAWGHNIFGQLGDGNPTYLPSQVLGSDGVGFLYLIEHDGPEMDVQGNGVCIANGDNEPSLMDHTDFGTVLVGGFLDRTFTVFNAGNEDLDLTASPHVLAEGDGFSVQEPPESPVAPGDISTFVVRFAPTASGESTGTVTIVNNDSDENAYTFAIKGEAIGMPSVTTVPVSQITNTSAESGGVVTNDGGDSAVARGVCWNTSGSPTIQEDSYTTDGSGLGNFTSEISGLALGTIYYVRAYATNYAGSIYGNELTFKTKSPPVALPDNYSVNQGQTLTISTPGVLANDSDPDDDHLTSELVSSTIHGALILNLNGSFTYTHDGGESTSDSFTYKAHGDSLNSEVTTVSITIHEIEPKIDVQGNAIPIANGDDTPSISDHTDFGNVIVGGSKERTFTIFNSGNDDLILTGGPYVSVTGEGFSIRTQPTSPIAPNSSATFVVSFTPTSSDEATGTVTIASNDPDENTFDFLIEGNGFTRKPSIEGGGGHTVALKENGTVWAWGYNNYGQLGDGTTTNRTTPMQVSGLSNVTAIAGAEYHTVALKEDGTVWAWGCNHYGQLGDGTSTNRPNPVQVSGLSNVTAIAGGSNHTIALKEDGTVWAWGYNACGQLGDGTTTNRTTPMQVSGLSNVTAIAGAEYHTVALKEDGTVWTWGCNHYGKLGDGTSTNRPTPVQVSGLSNVTAIAGGSNHTIALKEDGTVWAWGYNACGQLGDGTTTNRTTPMQVSGLTNITHIASGKNHTIALKNDGAVWIWGDNVNGQLGEGTTTNRTTPVQVLGLTNITDISGGTYHTIALKENGTVWVWGANYYGQLGDGTTSNQTNPIQASGLTNITNISGGTYHTIALKDDGTVWTWGHNGCGQLGDRTTSNRTTPVRVSGLTNITDIAGGTYHTITLKDDGTVWTWGHNGFGQLGDGTTSNRTTPVQVSGLTNITDIAGGTYHTITLKDDGTVWAWGDNYDGQLGDGGTSNRTTPVKVTGLTNITKIACGGQHTIALKDDGTVWAWGDNYYGQLGDGATFNRTTPSQVSGLTDITHISSGGYHSIAFKEDGSVWVWGCNNHGQLGDEATFDRTIPVQFSGLMNIANFTGGIYHTIALKENGTVWAWGYNNYGQSGDGATNQRTPVQISGLTNTIDIAGGGYHSIVLKADGAVWSWGYNQYGQLGNGHPTYLPVQTLGPDGIGFLYLIEHDGPEMDVQGNGVCIENGDYEPSLMDHTDYGTVLVGDFLDRTFTIFNAGNEDLDLAVSPYVLAEGDGFSVQEQPGSPVAPGGVATFVVRLSPTAQGSYEALASIASNDEDENPYTFQIKGEAYAPPEISASFSAVPESGFAPLDVAFFDESTGPVTNRLWEFGDGGTDTGETPVHTYEIPGTFDVTLTVYDQYGNEDSLLKTDLIAVTAYAPPEVVTGGAVAGLNEASLSGTINPKGLPTLGWFEYGETLDYGSITEYQDMGSGVLDVGFGDSVAGLKSGTTYHYRAVADNDYDVVAGEDRVFTTLEIPVVEGFSIDDGAAFTTQRTVVLNNAAAGSPTHYMASETVDFSDGQWLEYSASPEFILSEGYGTKTVYFKVKNTLESASVSDDILYEPLQERYELQNGYIYLSGIGGGIDVLKLDPDGAGAYRASVIHESGELGWWIDGVSFAGSGTFVETQEASRIVLNKPSFGTWEIILDGPDFVSALDLSNSCGEAGIRMDLPYRNSGYFDYGSGQVYDQYGYEVSSSQGIPFKTFYSATGNTRVVEYFMRTGDTVDHRLRFRTNETSDIDDYIGTDGVISGQPSGSNRLIALGSGDCDVDFFDLPSHRIWVEKDEDVMTLCSGRNDGAQTVYFSFQALHFDENEGVPVNETGGKMPYFYTSADETVSNEEGAEYSFDELLNRLYRQGAFFHTHAGQNDNWNWSVDTFGFVDSWYRSKLKSDIENWPQGDDSDGVEYDGYMFSLGDSPRVELGGHQLNTNANFIQAVWKYYAWTGDETFLTGQAQRVAKAMAWQLDYLNGSTAHAIDATGAFNNENNGRDGDMDSNRWDALPFGGKDAYASVDFYHSLIAMSQIETVLGNSAGAQDYLDMAQAAKTAYNDLFWSEQTNRYVGAIDDSGNTYDFGFSFVNLRALAAGLADADQASQVFAWLDTAQAYEPFRFAPVNNVVPVDQWWTGDALAWGEHAQNGGASLHVSASDIAARAEHLGPDQAYSRLKDILIRYSEPDKLTGGSPSFWGETVESDGSLGMIEAMSYDYPESGLTGAAFLHAFIGLELTAEGLEIDPRLPSNQEFIGAKNINYRGMNLNIHVTADSIQIECTDNQSAGDSYYVIDGVRKQFPDQPTFTLNEPYVAESRPAEISVCPIGYDFGAITTGETSTVQTFTVWNAGEEVLQIHSIAISVEDIVNATNPTENCVNDDTSGVEGGGGDGDPSDAPGIVPFSTTGSESGTNTVGLGSIKPTKDASAFSIASTNCPSSLSPGQTCEVAVTFNPSSPGSKTADLVVQSSDTAIPKCRAILLGEGMPDCTLNILEPDGVEDTSDSSYTIAVQWNGDCATVFAQIYYDTDNSGADGVLIGEIQSDATQIVWNTAQIAEGNYYIYAVVDYGTGNPSVSYSSNAVNILHGTSPVLEIPDAVQAYPDKEVSVPVNFVSNGHELAAATFSVDFDETCLEFDPTDGDGNGVPDSVAFDVPAGMTASVSYDASDTDGELDFVIMDMFMPFAVLQDGQIAEIVFTAKCTPSTDSIAADVLFSSDPELSFGDSSGRSVEGIGIGGFVEILAVAPGDANNDGKIDAGDISALVLEIFDGDGTAAGDASGGSYAGCAGADSNQDGVIDAADIVCIVLQIFNGPGACGSGKAPTGREPDPVPSFVIDGSSSVKSGEQVEVPIVLSSNGAEIAAATFSIDFDETCLAFDPTDGNGDGIPDAVVLNVPAQLLKSVSYDPSDTDGEIDVAIFNLMPPFQLIPDGAVATVTFTASCQPVENSEAAVVAFSEAPTPSFGDTNGQSVESEFVDGGVEVIPDGPFAADDAWTVDEGATLEVAAPGVMENDLSFEGGDLSSSLVDGPAHGDVVLNADGSFVYTHGGGESESDSFMYQVNDGFSDSNVAQVNLQVGPVNDPPVGVADAYMVGEGEVLEIESLGVLANDEDDENDSLSARLGQGTVHGTLDLQSDGSFSYTHDGGESETDSFTYFANDGQEDSLETVVTITVTPYNDPPSIAVSEPDVANEPADESFLIEWTDDDPDDNASVDLYCDTDNAGFDGVKITQSSVGEDDEADRFAWDTSAMEEGVYFVYAVIDDGVNEPVKAYASGSVEVDHNVAPEAEDDSYSLKEGETITVAAPGVLENDSDDDGDTIQAELVSDAQHGDLTFHADGSFTYEHDGGETLADSFSYKVSDGDLESEPATVSFQIEPVNDAPEAKDDSYEVDEGATLEVDAAEGVLANDEDVEDDSLTIFWAEGPKHGSLTLIFDGSFIYEHDGSETATDSFVYQCSDGIDESEVATVHILEFSENSAGLLNPNVI